MEAVVALGLALGPMLDWPLELGEEDGFIDGARLGSSKDDWLGCDEAFTDGVDNGDALGYSLRLESETG